MLGLLITMPISPLTRNCSQQKGPGAAATAHRALKISRSHSHARTIMSVAAFAESRKITDASSTVKDAWYESKVHHLALVPFEAKLRLYSVLRPSQNEPDPVRLAFLRFGRHTFDLDPSGALAVIAPVEEHGELQSLAAFSFNAPQQRQAYCGRAFAVGLDDAMLDARLHPDFRVRIFDDVWAWLQHGRSGILPVDWSKTALELKSRRIGGVVTSRGQAAIVERNLRIGLQPPRVYVDSEGVPT